MIALIDLHGQGVVAHTLGEGASQIAILPNTRTALRELAARRVDGLILEVARPDRELKTILSAARSAAVPALVVSRDRALATSVELLRDGASDCLVAPFEFDSLTRALERLRAVAAARGRDEVPFITRDPELLETLALLRTIAPSDATVLAEGESGTGKELLARLVHGASPRAARPLVTVNCAALPAGLLESELFGYERGAFTGALARTPGKFELADGGTILLDEIGELELGLQAKLLRVLQEKEVQRIGARSPLPVDFRLVATTNRLLAEEVQAGRFREDLFYRLNVLPVRLKPLRERPTDVPLLLEHFFSVHERRGRPRPRFAADALDALGAHDWPGNVRELENLVERLVLTHGGHEVRAAELGLPRLSSRRPTPDDPPFRTLREMERWLIVQTLKRTDGNRTHAARELDISLRTLRNKIRDFSIDDPDTLPRTGLARAPASTESGLARSAKPAQ